MAQSASEVAKELGPVRCPLPNNQTAGGSGTGEGDGSIRQAGA